MRRLLPLLLVPLLVLVACSDDDQDVTTDPGDATDGAPDGAPPGDPGGAEGGLVLSIETFGGFGTPEMTFRNTPTHVVYEDGLSVTQGAVLAIYPGPALYPLVEGSLDDAQIESLVAAAGDAGLLDEVDVGEPPVADAGTTRITVVVDGVEHVTDIPSFGFDEAGDGVTEDQAAARARIQAFVTEVSEVLTQAETTEMLAVDRYRVQAGPLVDADPEIEPNRLEWPFDTDPEPGECTAVTGEHAATLVGVLEQATEITVWTGVDGDEFSLAVRPVLPHEPDC